MAGAKLTAAGVESLVLLGCGRMGGAMLRGWLAAGLDPHRVQVIEPRPADWLREQAARGLVLNPAELAPATVAVIAVKPQSMDEALPRLAPLADAGTVFVSIAAGTPVAYFERVLGAGVAVVRAMPNTPAAIGKGISALFANTAAGERGLAMAEALLAAVGETVRLAAEDEMHAVTALSGSGPAYVFHMIEAMSTAGEAAGLGAALAARLARATVIGAGALAEAMPEPPSVLRENVTSPGGTTEAGLAVLMAELPDLLARTVAAAARRSRQLAGEE